MTTTDLHVLNRTRAEAIERSGWGRQFDLFQPRNLAFWVFWSLVIAGANAGIAQLRTTSETFATTVAVDSAIIAAYGIVLWLLTRLLDRYSTLPLALIAHAFVWGAAAATFFMALSANNAVLSLYGKIFGQAWVQSWGAGLTAPFTEEIAKGIGLVLLMTLAPHIVRTAFDGFVLGAFLGLGFLILEDVLYVSQSAGQHFGTDPFSSALQTLVLRIATGATGHISYSAIFGTGLLLLIGTVAQRRRPVLGLGLILTAMLLHGLWDNVGGLVGSVAILAPVIDLVLVAVTIVVVIAVYRFAVRGERDDLLAILAPEVSVGVLSDEEAAAAAGLRGARRAMRASLPQARRRDVNALTVSIRDLADSLAHHNPGQIEHRRAEVERIRAIVER